MAKIVTVILQVDSLGNKEVQRLEQTKINHRHQGTLGLHCPLSGGRS